MRLYSKLAHSTANGPGSRAVIWFAGCNLNCRNCWNPGTHSFSVSDTAIETLQDWILQLDRVSGITFSGGEPLQHYPDLLRLVRFIRTHRSELSIGMFTGYTTRELDRGAFQYMTEAFTDGTAAQWDSLRGLLDFAVCGRYNEQQTSTTSPLCGSSNQRIELFSTRYTLADFTEQITEVTISDNGLIQITGFPGVDFLNSIQEQ